MTGPNALSSFTFFIIRSADPEHSCPLRFEWICRALVKQVFCLAPRRVWVRGRQRNLFTASPRDVFRQKGRRLTRVQKSYFINQTRLKVLSYTGSSETVALYIAGSTVVFTVKLLYDCIHTSWEYGVNPVWSTKYVHIHFGEKDNCIV